MVDLRYRKAKGREPALLMQHRHQVALHIGQFALGDADLVAALSGHDDPRRTLRILVKGQPSHRPHEQIMQGEINQSRGEGREPQRNQEQVAREPVHRLTQRQFVDHDFDELPAAGRLTDHADRLVAGFKHGLERIDDRGPRGQGPHVDIVIDRRRQTGAGQ